MIKTKIHSPPFPINFKPASPNLYQTVDFGVGGRCSPPPHFPKSARKGCKLRGEASADPQSPGAPQTQPLWEGLSPLPARAPPLRSGCGISTESWSHCAHQLHTLTPSPGLSPFSFPLFCSYPAIHLFPTSLVSLRHIPG